MMKKLVAFLLVLCFAFCFAGCNSDDLGLQTVKDEEQGIVEFNTVNSFDFSDFKKEHSDTAKTEGFVNTEPKEFHNKVDAKELAVKELPEGYKYNTIRIFYDRTEGIWMVAFSTETEEGEVTAKCSVCVEDSGYTRLVVEE
ncbi:MAG: hypothetical protein IJZ57_09885 [Clostridia bacterium]|nr:hypothetical protein [Clostridia bacterium]